MAGRRRLNLPSELLPKHTEDSQEQPAASNQPAVPFNLPPQQDPLEPDVATIARLVESGMLSREAGYRALGMDPKLVAEEVRKQQGNIFSPPPALRPHRPRPAPTVIRTYADLARSLTDKMDRSRTMFVLKEGKIVSSGERGPLIGDVLHDEHGNQLGVITRVHDNTADIRGTTHYHLPGVRVDLRAPDGYHQSGIPVAEFVPAPRQVQSANGFGSFVLPGNVPFQPHTYVESERNASNRRLSILRADNFARFEENPDKIWERIRSDLCPDCGVDNLIRVWTRQQQIVVECPRCHHQFCADSIRAYRQYP